MRKPGCASRGPLTQRHAKLRWLEKGLAKTLSGAFHDDLRHGFSAVLYKCIRKLKLNHLELCVASLCAKPLIAFQQPGIKTDCGQSNCEFTGKQLTEVLLFPKR